MKPTSLYIHVPFCAAMCHYCDFAKTANFNDSHVQHYFDLLATDLRKLEPWSAARFETVFFGGGTPGMFTKELATLLNHLGARLTSDTECSIEANPNNVTKESLQSWIDHGVNRLSIGVQTLDPLGLKFLTRDHDPELAQSAVCLARQMITNVNVDLIYGWRNQTLDSWQQDLDWVVRERIPHVSLYNLTYEPRTPIGRAKLRGAFDGATDDQLVDFYAVAMERLAAAGYLHEEVSNWSLPGYSCRHNWVYWRGGSWIALGAGAHGSIDLAEQNATTRYAISPSIRAFLARAQTSRLEKSPTKLHEVLELIGGVVETERSIDVQVIEFIGAALRTSEGVDLNRLQKITGKVPNWRASVIRGIQEGLIRIENNRLYLAPPEWFRENAWALELIRSCCDDELSGQTSV